VVPGSGGRFYCENCIRDAAIARALIAKGHEVSVIPMYLPLLDFEGLEAPAPVFYGAIKLYLGHATKLLKRPPRWLARLLDSRPALGLAARMAGATRSSGLDGLTLSMLEGERGGQAAELGELVAWLREGGRPDVIHLSNALLSGLAPALAREVGAPVACSLQDEDTWLVDMASPAAGEAWRLMAENGRWIAKFVAPSRYYARFMAERLGLGPDRVAVAYGGVEADAYEPAPLGFDPPAIGFLSRESRALGLDVLAEAFAVVAKRPGMERLELRVAGGSTSDDSAFLRGLKSRLNATGLGGRVSFHAGLRRVERAAFLRGLSVLSVPAPEGAAFGLYLIEAAAAGVPVVQPRVGAYPEIVEATGGGVVYDGSGPEPLAEALFSVLSNPARARELGARGRAAALGLFSAERAAERLIAVYEGLAAARGA
jgi:glycosyltransferase involved in cell wall biosynthesis